jgi:hypothetical protein
MKVQKPGRAVGVWNTPANKIIIVNRIVTTRPAVVASGKGDHVTYQPTLREAKPT